MPASESCIMAPTIASRGSRARAAGGALTGGMAHPYGKAYPYGSVSIANHS